MSAGQETLELPAAAPTRAAPTGHFRKFRLALVGLFVVCLGSLGAALALSTGSRRHVIAGNWSSWSPSDNGLAGSQEIADYLAPYYRATPADQLAVVTAVNLKNPASPLQIVVPSTSSSGSLIPLPSGSTVLFNLCGTGSGDCSIGAGTPSSARLLLLRREALELALYTFKYIDGAQTVVAILPPGRTVQGCVGICAKPQVKTTTRPLSLALAFDRSELGPWLGRPVRETLPEDLPPTVSQMQSAPEAELVSVLTAHGLFSERVEQAQDGSSVVVLSPLPPQ
jgi:hypothetical protein